MIYTSTSSKTPNVFRTHRSLLASLAAIALALLVLAPAALASKQTVDFFGGDGTLGGQFGNPSGIAVNDSGAGPANPGDIYVLDVDSSRVQRFGRDDNGTPADGADDTYFFISAWGADVDSTPLGGTDYEICTVAAECQAGVASGGNGTAAGNGALGAFGFSRGGLAIDQDTGNLFVSDLGNNRVNVYDGSGVFLRSFGYDVIASGPGHVTGPDEQQQLTVKATGGKFSLDFNGATTGARGTGRFQAGSNIIDINTSSGAFTVGQVISAFTSGGEGIVPAGTTITAVGKGTLTLSQAATITRSSVDTFGDNLTFDSSAAQVQAALNALPTIGGVGGAVTVSGGPGDLGGSSPYAIKFGGAFVADDQPLLTSSASGLSIASGTPSAAITEVVKGGAYEVCVAADGDVCKVGGSGAAAGETGEGAGIAVSQADGNPATGTVFLADPGNRRIGTFGLDGLSPSSFGSAAVFSGERPNAVAVDSRGIVYASNQVNQNQIERYDSENANGGGVGFLAPISAGVDEVQEVTVAATAGTFKLSFGADSTVDIPFNWPGKDGGNSDGVLNSIQDALLALPSVGANSNAVGVSGGLSEKTGVYLYKVAFHVGLGAKDVPQLIASDGATPLSGGAGASVATTTSGQPGLLPESNFSEITMGLAVDPATDTLYVLRSQQGPGVVQQFGPSNPPGLTAPPAAADDIHGTSSPFVNGGRGLARDQATGRLYAAVSTGLQGFPANSGVYVLDDAGPPATASLDSLSDTTFHSVVAHATIDPNGPPVTRYHFEYSTDGSKWASTPEVVLGGQDDPQAVTETIDPPPFGLESNTLYQVRLVAGRAFAAPIVTPALTFTTDPADPLVETTGTPLRTMTTAQLQGRVTPRNSATTYHFEYGSEGPCEANPCTATPDEPAGAGVLAELVAESIEGLQPDTTYHYRLVADNAAAGPPVAGEDMTVTTRVTDELPGQSDEFPGPPGSDRAYEQVNMPDTGGNPAFNSLGFSDDGNRAIYQVLGGTPLSEAGSILSIYSADRTPLGWQTRLVTPRRSETPSSGWFGVIGPGDLSSFATTNGDTDAGTIWRLIPGGEPAKLFEPTGLQQLSDSGGDYVGVSADGSRTVAGLVGGTLDPGYPAAAAKSNLYDISTGGIPQLVSLLPGDVVPPCGVVATKVSAPAQSSHWVSPDGSFVFFSSRDDACAGAFELYLRDLDAGVTKLISGPPLSGSSCGASLVKATAGAVFISTATRLAAEDTVGCSSSNDVYRYDLAAETFECVTCVVPGLDARVQGSLEVSEDGSHLYFGTNTQLLPGAPPNGSTALYRVEVSSGSLAYVAPVQATSASLTPDGSRLFFTASSPDLDPLGGMTNGGTSQIYRYDDGDRSLICVSCPRDGQPPLDKAKGSGSNTNAGLANTDPLADDGTFAFSAATALVDADQNTKPGDPEVGTDVYEWRDDGRLLLVTDGLTDWVQPPLAVGISPSGRDVYFNAAAQYTPDAIDAYGRIYDARIGGGIEFPPPPQPCPLEVCQGTPKGAPEEASAGSTAFRGPGNVRETARPTCKKGKVRRRGRCVSRKRHSKRSIRRASNHNGRTVR